MINCLSFSPLFLSFYLPIAPLNTLFPSILYPLITIFFLNFLFFSSLPDLPSASSYSCSWPSSLMTLFFSLSFVPCSVFLLSASFVILDLTVVTSTFASSPLLSLLSLSYFFLHRSRAHLGCLINSMLCNLRYVFEPASPFFFMSYVIIYFLQFSTLFRYSFFYLTFLLVTPVCMPVSVCFLHTHVSLPIPKQYSQSDLERNVIVC